MDRINALTPVKDFGLAALLFGLNPKNLPLSIAAGTTIATVPIGGPVLCHVAVRTQAE